MTLVWTRPAIFDLAEIDRYISERNPRAAQFIAEKIRYSARLLESQPHVERLGRKMGTRELVISGTPFILVYELREAVTVLRVLHGARQWPPTR